MAEVTVLFKIIEEPSKEQIHERLNWYDSVKQRMLFFYGGKLAFKYQEDDYLLKMGAIEREARGIKSTYRMLPVVEYIEVDNHFRMVKKTNQKEIENWFYKSNYVNDVSIKDIEEADIIFEVPENEKEDFCYDLERQGFKYT